MKKKCSNVIITIFFASVFMLSLSAGCAKKTQSKAKEQPASAMLARPGDDLQAVLDSGKDLLLEKNGVYETAKTLVYKFPGQKISTKDAVHISDYATLRITASDLMLLVDGARKDNIVLENVILDGNRYQLSTVAKKELTGGGGQPPMVFFGGVGAKGQKVINNVLLMNKDFLNFSLDEARKELVWETQKAKFLGAIEGL